MLYYPIKENNYRILENNGPEIILY